MWYHQHNVGHHAYTNDEKMDPDISMWAGGVRLHPNKKYFSVHKYQYYLLMPIWLIVEPAI